MPVRLQSRKQDFERARRCRNRLWHFYSGVSTKAQSITGAQGKVRQDAVNITAWSDIFVSTGRIVVMDVRRKPANKIGTSLPAIVYQALLESGKALDRHLFVGIHLKDFV